MKKECVQGLRLLRFSLISICGLFLSFMGFAAHAQHSLPPQAVLCSACHGVDGNSTVAGTPSLAGQPKTYLENQLVVIREGLRPIAVMKGMLDKVTDEDIGVLSKFYAAQPVKATQGITFGAVDKARIARGEQLSKQGLCGTCHLPDFSGRDQMPRLAGQREDFLLANMKEFRDGTSKGRDTMMMAVLRGWSDAQLADAAHFFASFGQLK